MEEIDGWLAEAWHRRSPEIPGINEAHRSEIAVMAATTLPIVHSVRALFVRRNRRASA